MGTLNIRVEAEGVAIIFSIADGSIAVEQTTNKVPPTVAPKAVLSPPRAAAANGAAGGVIEHGVERLAADGPARTATGHRRACRPISRRHSPGLVRPSRNGRTRKFSD